MKIIAQVDFNRHINYDIYCGYHVVQEFVDSLDLMKPIQKIILITDENVESLHLALICEFLYAKQYKVLKYVLTSGRKQKALGSIESILKLLFENGADQSSILVSIGGGVVGDVGGVVAALYLRGIRYIQMPTTLLSQVDSSIGGKVGINYPHHLNGIGHYYYPKSVWVDLAYLDTLPYDELIAGVAEVVKYSVVLDRPLFEYLENNAGLIRQRDKDVIEYIVKHCIAKKASIVSEDPSEIGHFKLFTYGHEIGHALEVVFDYQGLRHGEAVAIGMLGAAWISKTLGLMKNEDILIRQKKLLSELGLPVRIPNDLVEELGGSEIFTKSLFHAIKIDKKRINEQNIWVLPTDIGFGIVTDQLNDDLIIDCISYLLDL